MSDRGDGVGAVNQRAFPVDDLDAFSGGEEVDDRGVGRVALVQRGSAPTAADDSNNTALVSTNAAAQSAAGSAT